MRILNFLLIFYASCIKRIVSFKTTISVFSFKVLITRCNKVWVASSTYLICRIIIIYIPQKSTRKVAYILINLNFSFSCHYIVTCHTNAFTESWTHCKRVWILCCPQHRTIFFVHILLKKPFVEPANFLHVKEEGWF